MDARPRPSKSELRMSIHNNPYGVGLAYRYHLHEEVMHFAADIDLLEIPTEDHIIRRRALSYPFATERFAEASSQFPCVAHGISLSLGSIEPLDDHYIQSTRRFMDETGISVFSEHLAYHRMDGTDIASFLQMPFDEVSLEWLVQKYQVARQSLGMPIALENVSFSFPVAGGDYSEPEFLAEFLRRTDATLLLDVTNLYNNCTNYSLDPIEYIHTLPPDRISQMHLAGGHFDDSGFLIDSHSFMVMDDVWELYRECLKHTQADIVILERDYQCLPFSEVLHDLRKAREIFYELRPSQSRLKPATITATGPSTASMPDFQSAQYSNLRSFQRTILKSITDDEFRRATRADLAVAAETFPMARDWLARYAACPKLDDMAESWKETERLNNEDQERFQQWEWSQFLTINNPVGVESR